MSAVNADPDVFVSSAVDFSPWTSIPAFVSRFRGRVISLSSLFAGEDAIARLNL